MQTYCATETHISLRMPADEALLTPPVTIKGVAYFTRFGETVPKELCRWAVNTSQAELLEQMLTERIQQGRPVEDWHEFARPLVEPLLEEAEHLTRKRRV
ncbi:MAG: hypothetical protein HQL47_10905 [Gammaproteobacteria bacterium]|nr:hypothetical protein [Gammaproteobacteria bacterium]